MASASERFFDAKYFNPEAFGKYMESVPDVRRNKLLESGAIVRDNSLVDLFSNQTGSYFATKVFFGNLEGDPDNYDGNTDITEESTETYRQGVFVYGRAKGFMEKDFSKDITAGTDFMGNVRRKLMKYWNDVDQDTMLSILKGVFSMASGAKNLEFVELHTNDITGAAEGADRVGPTTLNNTIQKAGGDNKEIFKLAIMHSQVATNLENVKAIEYLKYTDAKGVERDLELATWNGRIVIVDDGMPTETVSDSAGDYTAYTTYILGDSAITHQPILTPEAYEMVRDAKTNGGQTTLISRKRHAVAVEGISYSDDNQASLSPTNAELEKGSAWSLVKSAKNKYWDHKAIPIARIISRG